MSIPQKGLIFYAGGNSATSVLSGNVDPTTEGGPGDFYINLTSGALFGPKDPSTGWPATPIDLTGVADGSVTTIKLADDAVTQAKIADNAVGADQIAADAVGSSEIAADAVGSSEIAANAVGSSELADNAVDTAAIQDSAVTSGKLASGSVTNAKIGTNAVDLTKLSTGVQSALVPSSGKVNGYILVTDGTNHGWFNPANSTFSQSQISGLSTTLAGKADLDGNGKVLTSQLPALAITSVYTAADQAAQLALTVQEGDVVVRSDQSKSYIHNGGSAGTMADFTELKTPTDAVLSVNGDTGAVTITPASIGAAEAVHTHTKSDITDFDDADYAAASHTHAISDVTNLQTELDGKADDAHTHAISDVTNLQTELDGKADDVHTHVKADITDFDETDYAAAVHTHVKADITDFDESDYAAAVHTHSINDTTGLQDALDAKQDDLVRTTVTQSVTVSAGAEVSIDLEMSKTYLLTKIESTKECRLRLYQSSAARTADQSRNSVTPPSTQGLVCEVIMDSDLVTEGLLLNPPQVGFNASNSATTKALVKNNAASADLSLTLTYVKLEV